MRTALAVIVAALLLVGSLGWLGYEVYALASQQAQDHADLGTALTANQTQAGALAQLQADRDADARRVADLVQTLQTISAVQASQRAAFAKVLTHATPAEMAVLNGHLPAAVVQLFPRSAGATATGASHPPDNP